MGVVAQVVLDLSERLVLGQIDETLGHLAQGGFGVGAELLDQRLDACLSVIGDL